MTEQPATGAELLVRRLKLHGVRHVFGYPGGQLTPVYDALYREPAIRHILARDEQAAAFMADGYARATGRVGVCLVVCGPGVYNAATPLATAFTDSVPVLLISGQVPTAGLGLRTGYYHENDQLAAVATMTKWRGRPAEADQIPGHVDMAMTELPRGRPGPGLLEIPLDVLRTETAASFPPPEPPPRLSPPSPSEVVALAELLSQWQRPAILAGGGVLSAGAETQLRQLAERLGAPVFTTLMGKGAFPADHPLAMGLPWHQATSDLTDMAKRMSPLWQQADGVLAIGCRFSQAATGSWCLPTLPLLAQIDIDPAELGRHYPVTLGIHADARLALEEILVLLPTKARPPWATKPPRATWRLPGVDLVGPLRAALPRDAIVVADITRLAYIMLADFPVHEPRTFLHPAGFVSMGFGIPAALGARAAFPDRPVVAVVGDGCFLMSGMELATAVQEKLPIVVILINDESLTLIRSTQERRYESRFIAVDLKNPDFGQFAGAFGVRYWRADDDAAFAKALGEALGCGEPALIEVRIKK